jgi:hypothetical protein
MFKIGRKFDLSSSSSSSIVALKQSNGGRIDGGMESGWVAKLGRVRLLLLLLILLLATIIQLSVSLSPKP